MRSACVLSRNYREGLCTERITRMKGAKDTNPRDLVPRETPTYVRAEGMKEEKKRKEFLLPAGEKNASRAGV